jgi:hypothetical protein
VEKQQGCIREICDRYKKSVQEMAGVIVESADPKQQNVQNPPDVIKTPT